jgi:ATP-dependent DNA ligase
LFLAFQRKNPAAIGVKVPFPGFIEPALATSIEKVPGGQRWLHEIKHDGYRLIVQREGDRVRLFTRRGVFANARSILKQLVAIGLPIAGAGRFAF